MRREARQRPVVQHQRPAVQRHSPAARRSRLVHRSEVRRKLCGMRIEKMSRACETCVSTRHATRHIRQSSAVYSVTSCDMFETCGTCGRRPRTLSTSLLHRLSPSLLWKRSPHHPQRLHHHTTPCACMPPPAPPYAICGQFLHHHAHRRTHTGDARVECKRKKERISLRIKKCAPRRRHAHTCTFFHIF